MFALNNASLLGGTAVGRNDTPDRVVRDKVTSTLETAAVSNQVLMHGEDVYRSRAQRQPIGVPGADDTVMIYPCSLCSERFVSKEDLDCHLSTFTKNGCPKPVTCAVCEKRFHSMSERKYSNVVSAGMGQRVGGHLEIINSVGVKVK